MSGMKAENVGIVAMDIYFPKQVYIFNIFYILLYIININNKNIIYTETNENLKKK